MNDYSNAIWIAIIGSMFIIVDLVMIIPGIIFMIPTTPIGSGCMGVAMCLLQVSALHSMLEGKVGK